MRKNPQSEDVGHLVGPTEDDVARWLEEAPAATPHESAVQDMRKIAERHAAALVEAFSKLPKHA